MEPQRYCAYCGKGPLVGEEIKEDGQLFCLKKCLELYRAWKKRVKK